jgi:hypothetical protein
MSQDTAKSDEHPAPQRGRVSIVASLASLIAGPAAWILQLVIGYGLSSLACFPHDIPLRQSPPPGWSAEPLLLGAINGVCLAIAILGGVTALLHWRRTRGESSGGAGHVLEIGEGRTRFLAACGMLSAFGFALAILFDTPAIMAVPACWSILL